MFKTLEGISDITVVYDGNKTYQLKKAHSIEKMTILQEMSAQTNQV